MAEIEITWGDNRKLLTMLADSGAKVLIIGGTAVRFHAPDRRPPNDLDLLVEPTEDAAKALLHAVSVIVGRPLPITAQQLARPLTGFPEKTVLNIDVLTPPAEFSFAEIWASAVPATMSYSNTTVSVASIPTLIEWLSRALMKEPSREAAIRSDLALLEAAARRAR